MTKKSAKYGPLVLRLFFGTAFIVAGLNKAISFSSSKIGFSTLFGQAGTIMLILAIVIETGAGLALLLGFHTRYSAFLLTILMIIATISTFKMGHVANILTFFEEILLRNSAGGNTGLQFTYLAGLISLVLTGSNFKALKPD